MSIGKCYLNPLWGLVAVFLTLFQAGCTGLKAFPLAARSGDTVALALGSADGMSHANTTATFVSDANPSVPYDVTSGIRGIFRLYADKTSSVYAPGSTAAYIVNSSGHEPWLTVMVVDLPQGLPVGPGQVRITTTASYPTIGSHINDRAIGLEIVPGTGSADSLAYEFGLGASMDGDLTQLESQPHAEVMPPFPESTDWPSYGAIEMKLRTPTSAGMGIRVQAENLDVATGSKSNVLYRRDGNQDLTVIFTSTRGRLRSYEARFSVILVDSQDQGGGFSELPALLSVNYYDLDGNLSIGPQAADYVVQMR